MESRSHTGPRLRATKITKLTTVTKNYWFVRFASFVIFVAFVAFVAAAVGSFRSSYVALSRFAARPRLQSQA